MSFFEGLISLHDENNFKMTNGPLSEIVEFLWKQRPGRQINRG